MLIPNDKGDTWRLGKFVEYQHHAPAIDPITLVEFAKRRKLDKDDLVLLAWYHSLTYCEITAGFLFDRLSFCCSHPDEVGDYAEDFWKEHKPNLVFGSARKYVKNMDWFVPLMETFFKDIAETDGNLRPYAWLQYIAGEAETDAQTRYKNIEKYLGKWKFMGRFSIDLFTEEIIAFNQAGLLPLEIESAGYDWKKTSNLTSGLLNIFYMDDAADEFDRGDLPITPPLNDFLNKKLWVVLREVKKAYPHQKADKVSVVNKICSFRNLFKKARYGGFHHDRQLGNLVHYGILYPEYDELWQEFYDIRRDLWPIHMLGEANNWTGIRKERKKLWIEKGLTGVESSS
jgi:hypothetical protein